ncbi:MAG: transglutaminase domain-containing protein [Salinivirgaceae bacterium]
MLSIFTCIIAVHSEEPPIKFGILSDEEIKMAYYEYDSAAPAVILCNFGEVKNTLSDYGYFNFRFTRNLRIKIFKKEGYKYARHEFYMSSNANNPTLKAITYNTAGDKISEDKLDKKQIFRGHIDKNYDVLTFEMPAVKEGSIMDLEFSYETSVYYLLPWYFQTTIPTCHSEYRISIPEFFYVKQLEKGFYPIGNKSTNTKMTTKIGQVSSYVSAGNIYKEQNRFDYQETEYTFLSNDVPAFTTEEYLTSIENYLSSIQFEIGSLKMPNQPIKNFSTTWEAIGIILMGDTDFGSRINAGGFIKEDLAVIESMNNTSESKMEAVYQYIRNKMNWNNQNSIYSYDPKKAWEERKGSCGDINLLLVSALNRLGFDAKPVILSTRANGFVHPAQIMIDQFNYVIASVKLNDKLILLDATDKNLPVGILPERCLNGQGRMIDDKEGCWIDLNPTAIKKEFFMVTMNLNSDGILTGKVNEKYEGYAALEKRAKLNLFTTEADYLKEYQKSFQKLSMEPDSITDKLNLSKPITINYHFESDEIINKAGELLYINPIIISRIETNPFKLEKREYPVDFSFLKSTNYMINMNIPDGFVVENLPENKKMVLPDKTATFIYSVQQTGNSISIVSKFNINKVIFLPEEYLDLKEFYNQVIDALSKQIILKKI